MNQIPWSLLCPPTLQACKNLNLQSLQPAHSLLHIKPDFALRITFTLILDGSKSVILFFGILLLMLVLTEVLSVLVTVFVFLLVKVGFLITLINCLTDHMSQTLLTFMSPWSPGRGKAKKVFSSITFQLFVCFCPSAKISDICWFCW